MVGDKTANIVTKVSRSSSQNTSETVESKIKIPKEIYKFPEKRQKIIDIRLM